MLRKKFTAVAMSAVLAVSLCPGLAVAAPLTGGSVATPAKTTQPVKTQAKKKTVYVLTDYVQTGYSWKTYDKETGAVDQGSRTYTPPATTTTTEEQSDYKYTTNGLLETDYYYALTYKGANLKSAVEYVAPGSTPYETDNPWKYTFKSKKGLVKSQTYTRDYTGTDAAEYKWYYSDKWTTKYSYDKKGNLTKAVRTDYDYQLGDKIYNKFKKFSTTTTNYTLNKKGLASKSSSTTKYFNKSTETSATTKYSYDKKKNLKKAVTPYSNATTYKYSGYKKGVPTKLVVTKKSTTRLKSGASATNTKTYTYTLTYKPMKVSKSYVSTVKRQQWAMLNGSELNNAAFGSLTFGVDDFYQSTLNYSDED